MPFTSTRVKNFMEPLLGEIPTSFLQPEPEPPASEGKAAKVFPWVAEPGPVSWLMKRVNGTALKEAFSYISDKRTHPAAVEAVPKSPRSCFAECHDDSLPSKQRDPFWDNWKGLGQILVLTMHLGGAVYTVVRIDELVTTRLGQLYMGFQTFITLFTMPAYCFISGYFSSINLNARKRTELVRYSVAWIAQHIICCIGTMSLTYAKLDSDWHREHPHLNATNAELEAEGQAPLSPPGHMPVPFFRAVGMDWYLWCVIIWRCLLPIIAQLRCPLLASTMLGCAIMFTDASGSTYANAPFAFMPFFVFGFVAKEKKQAEIEWIRNSYLAMLTFLAASLVLIGLPAYSSQLGDQVDFFISRNLGCLYGGDIAQFNAVSRSHTINEMRKANMVSSFSNMTNSWFHPAAIPVSQHCQTGGGVVQVLIFYVISACMIVGFMTVVPATRNRFLTRAGINSIYIYFGGTYIQMAMGAATVVLMLNGIRLPLPMALSILSAIVMASWLALSQPCFKCFCRPLIEPRVEGGCLRLTVSDPEEGSMAASKEWMSGGG